MNDSGVNNSVAGLLVGDLGNDQSLLRDIFQQLGWSLFEAPARRQAMKCLQCGQVQVVVASDEVAGWNWKQVLSDLHGLPRQPQLIVVSRLADDRLWSEVLNFGGFDVLARPLDRDEVERVVAAAHRRFDFHPARARAAAAASAANAA